MAGGGLTSLGAYAVTRRSPLAAAALVGGYLIYRGAAGYCPVSDTLGLPTLSAPSEPLQVERSVTINRSAADLYAFWRNLENLSRFMQHLEVVRVQGPTRSHWVASAPGGTVVEWDAEIVEERENELIAWCSLPGSQVDTAGSVRFHPATGGRGTVVTARLEYVLPAGRFGATVAKVFGKAPEQQMREVLRRFKSIIEAGEAPTTAGQPSCREEER